MAERRQPRPLLIEIGQRAYFVAFSLARANVWVVRDLNVSAGSRHRRFS